MLQDFLITTLKIYKHLLSFSQRVTIVALHLKQNTGLFVKMVQLHTSVQLFYIFIVNLCVCMCTHPCLEFMCIMLVQEDLEGQRTNSTGPLEQEPQAVVSLHVGVDNQTWVLFCKNSKYS